MKQAYKERFSRSLGIISEDQLKKIKETSIAVAGLGLGGAVVINLVRMGFEKFHIADPDIFERTNVNRQRLAKENTLGKRKDDCVIEEAKAINPDVEFKTFPMGINENNLFEFLTGIDWAIDVVDIFAMRDKLALHAEARKRHIPVASYAAVGFGGTVVMFNDKTPSFQELTGMHPQDHFVENLEKFLQFIAPEIPEYMKEQLLNSIDRSTHVPFVVPGGEITAAFCVSEIVKSMMSFGKRVYAPQGIFVDAFHHRIEIYKAHYLARSFKFPVNKKNA